jgi:hypothetical protein
MSARRKADPQGKDFDDLPGGTIAGEKPKGQDSSNIPKVW